MYGAEGAGAVAHAVALLESRPAQLGAVVTDGRGFELRWRITGGKADAHIVDGGRGINLCAPVVDPYEDHLVGAGGGHRHGMLLVLPAGKALTFRAAVEGYPPLGEGVVTEAGRKDAGFEHLRFRHQGHTQVVVLTFALALPVVGHNVVAGREGEGLVGIDQRAISTVLICDAEVVGDIERLRAVVAGGAVHGPGVRHSSVGEHPTVVAAVLEAGAVGQRDGGLSGNKADTAAIVVRCIIAGDHHLHIVTAVLGEARESVGGSVGDDGVGAVAVEDNLPFGGVAVLGPGEGGCGGGDGGADEVARVLAGRV